MCMCWMPSPRSTNREEQFPFKHVVNCFRKVRLAERVCETLDDEDIATERETREREKEREMRETRREMREMKR